MATSREQLIFDVLANTSRAESGFQAVGRKASAASDDVSGLARRLDEISQKSATARVNLEGDKEALDQLDRLDFKMAVVGNKVMRPDVTVEGAARASFEISALDAQLDKLGSKGGGAGKAESGLAALTGGGGIAGGGMGALVAAGIALAGQLVTVGFGLAGLAGAAYGVIKPIETAAQKTGGLQQNLHTLDSEQQTVARSILGLEHGYDAFQRSLAPQILTGFNDAIRIAGHLMGDVQPIAKQTGNALDTVLGSIDKEFASGTWQQFFSWMAATAGPDVQLLGKNFTDLLNVIPPLVQDLQPLGHALLLTTDDVAKLAGGVATLYGKFQNDVPISNQHTLGFFQDLDKWTVSFTNHLGPWARAINNSGTAAQDALKGTTSASQKLISPAKQAADELQAMATATQNLMTAQQNSLNTQVTYGSDLVTSADDAVKLRKALSASRDMIGLHTNAERFSFAAANTYITDLGNTAKAAYDSGHGVDAAIKAISGGLPILDSAKTKNRQYWQEVQILVGWLHKLQAQGPINLHETLTGKGLWSLTQTGGKLAGPTGTAAGWLVSGGSPGRDSVPIMAMPGELVVPARMVSSGAVDHLRGRIPGFAAGGIVPSYTGTVSGLVPWDKSNNAAFASMFAAAAAQAMWAGIKSARSSAAAAGGGFGTPGPGGGDPAANAALARRMFPAQNFAAWNYVAMAESGWNQFARNPTSGAYGIPQALPPSKMGAAANPPQSNPAAQISWMNSYMNSVYGGATGAAAHEAAFHWYDTGGFLYPGKTLAVNNTGQPERVTSPAQETAMLAKLDRIITLLQAAPDRTGAALGGALHGAARGALQSGRYSAR